jgi:hypothetical protein
MVCLILYHICDQEACLNTFPVNLGAEIAIKEKLMSEISLFLLTKRQMKSSFHTEGKVIALLLGCGEDTDCILLSLECVGRNG